MPSQTLIFDEQRNRFETFASYEPEMMVTLGTTLCSFREGVLYTHDDEGKYNNFYGVQYNSEIQPVFNQNELNKKTFLAMEQLASQAWRCPVIETSSNEYQKVKQLSNLVEADFEEFEGNYDAAFLGATNSIGGINDGSSLKGNLMTVKLTAVIPEPPNNTLVSLNLVTVKSITSPVNPR